MTDGSDPFSKIAAAVKDGSEAGAPLAAKGPEGDLVAPVPGNAPEPSFHHPRHGRPAMIWTYRDGQGQTLGHVARFDTEGGGKEILPRTFWRTEKGLQWRWKSFNLPRPLYGLDQLAKRPGAPVLIVEGEKTADAAAALFADHVATTWPGGSKAVAKVDWTPLAGRMVTIWPDADTPGLSAALAVQQAASRAGAASVAIVEIPADLPAGWDLADPWPAGLSLDDAQGLIAIAHKIGPKPKASAALEWPPGYRLDDQGLWHDEVRDHKVHPKWLCGPFEVQGLARDPDGNGWAVVIEFCDPDSLKKHETISLAQLTASPGEVRARLAGRGLRIATQKAKAESFVTALIGLKLDARITLCDTTGWIDADRFSLPAGMIAHPSKAHEPALFTGNRGGTFYRQAGQIDRWRAEVASLAVDNPLLMFALSIGFSGPLIMPCELDGGGFHFRGGSSSGKSTLAIAAGSIWGGGGKLGFAHSWRSTANALEGTAKSHSDTLLILDELALVAAEEAGQAAYALASGQAKARSKADGSLRDRTEWRVQMISTGEISLADHIQTSRRGDRPMAGQEMRLVDMIADAGQGMGIWTILHGHKDPADQSEALRAATQKHYGHAGPVFVQAYLNDPDFHLGLVKTAMARFMAAAEQEGDTGQVHRVARRFALVAAAGELATMLGVTHWREGAAFEAALGLFKGWADAYGRDAPREAQAILQTLKGFIDLNPSAFGEVKADSDDFDSEAGPRAGESRSLSRYGWHHSLGGQAYYLLHKAGWDAVFLGRDPAYAARVVYEAGYLEKGDGKHWQKAKKIRGQTQRLYWVKAEILGL
jgi:putative DNA primase/helicase